MPIFGPLRQILQHFSGRLAQRVRHLNTLIFPIHSWEQLAGDPLAGLDADASALRVFLGVGNLYDLLSERLATALTCACIHLCELWILHLPFADGAFCRQSEALQVRGVSTISNMLTDAQRYFVRVS